MVQKPLKTQLFKKAEKRRKEGNVRKALRLYVKSIAHCEAAKGDANSPFLDPEPYRQYAKLSYHLGNTEKAVEILDRYARLRDVLEQFRIGGHHNTKLRGLRRQFATGKFRQMHHLYDYEEVDTSAWPPWKEKVEVTERRLEKLGEKYDRELEESQKRAEELMENFGHGRRKGTSLQKGVVEPAQDWILNRLLGFLF